MQQFGSDQAPVLNEKKGDPKKRPDMISRSIEEEDYMHTRGIGRFPPSVSRAHT